MLKQSPSRNQRAKGFKVKHALQICLLLAICIWLLYQVKCSRDMKAAFVDSSTEILGKTQDNGHEIIIKLGRRSLHPRMEIDNHGANEDELHDEVVEELKLEEETEAVGRDEDIDVPDQERAEEGEPEEVEDLIDEEDREREEVNVEQDGEESDLDDLHSLEEIQNEGKSNSQEAIEEQVQGDGGSSIVMQNSKTLSRSLRGVRDHEIEMEKIKTNDKQDHIVGGMKDLDPKMKMKMKMRLKAKSLASEHNVEGREKGVEFSSAYLGDDTYSSSSTKAKPSTESLNNQSSLLISKGLGSAF